MKKILGAAAIIISSSLAHAQTKDSATLSEVIVTANKIEQKQSETGKVLTVISRKEIEKNYGRSISEILNEQVGIVIGGANNNAGTNQTIYVRGANSANTLVMMDGIPLNDPSGVNSEFDLNTFAVDQIERIEILKGAQSTLYGSDAVAGVINIITRKEKGNHATGQIAAGSFGTARVGFGVNGTKNKFNYRFSYSHFSTAGYSSAKDTIGNKVFDKDAFEQHVFQGKIGFEKGGFTTSITGKYNINNAAIDAGAFKDDRDYTYQTKNIITGWQGKYQLKNGYLNALYNYNYYERTYLDDSSNISGMPYAQAPTFSFIYQDGLYKGRSHYAELMGNFSINSAVNIVAGIDYRHNSTNQSYTYSIKDFGTFTSLPLNRDTALAKQFAVYASLLYNKKDLNIGAGVRYNKHSVYGNVFTWSINPSYRFNNFKVFANAATAFRMPTLYQLFGEYGNRLLKPEQSLNLEGGLQYSNAYFTTRAVAFSRNINDVFSFYSDPVTYLSNYINEDKQNDHGIEFEISSNAIKGLQLSFNYAFTNGKLNTKTTAGKDTSYYNLYRRPKNVYNAKVAYQITKQWQLSIYGRGVSSFIEPRYLKEPLLIKGYVILNVYSELKLNNSFRFFIDFQNITDKQYQDQPGFNTRPSSFTGGLVFRF